MNLTVGDLYCGAGGFAEGFRQAGFRVKWAIDSSPEAAKTFKKNHPGTDVMCQDILSLSPRRLSKVDAVIGSPPCTDFSLANRGGTGDKAAGMKLVVRFLEIVQALDPKYWIMENVPNLLPEIEHLLGEDDAIRLPRGRLKIPRREILVASEYGTPQSRKRLFCGDYPLPDKTTKISQKDSFTLGRILRRIPPPCHPAMTTARIQDPVYPSLRIPSSKLRAHFEDSRWTLSAVEIEWCRRQKARHSVYGEMQFPDDLDAPARTITSTRTHASRSTIVVPCYDSIHSEGLLRTLTARECASAQAFPLSYQFWGDSMSDIDHMIGNAVPPSMSLAFATAILRGHGLEPPKAPRLTRNFEPAPPMSPRPRRTLRYAAGRRFRGVCECEWSRYARVELDNAGENSARDSITSATHSKQWVARLYLGYAKKYKGYELDSAHVGRMVERVCQSWPEGSIVEPIFRALMEDSVQTFAGSLPGAAELQNAWSGRGVASVAPSDILRKVDRLVDRHLHKKDWTQTPIPSALYATTITRQVIAQGSLAEPGCPRNLTVRMLGALRALSIACDEVNRGSNRRAAFGNKGVPPIKLSEESRTLDEARMESLVSGR